MAKLSGGRSRTWVAKDALLQTRGDPTTSTGAIVATVVAMLLGTAPIRAQEIVLPSVFDPEVAVAEQAFPGLLEFIERPGGRALLAVGKEPLAELYRRLAEEPFSAETRAALRVILQAYSRYLGAPSTEGRQILVAAAGIASASGERSTLRGVAELLVEFAEDPTNPYALLARDVLAEKVRCGASAQGDDALIRSIQTRIDPGGGFQRAHADREVGDAFGLHHGADLFAVAARGARVVAVGDFGTVLVSDDAGESWLAPATGTDRTLYAAAFGPGDELWAVGRGGAIVYSENGGQTMDRRKQPFKQHLFGVYAPKPESAIVVGDFGLQLETDDAGRHWRCRPREQDVILGRIAPAGGDAVVVGEFATLERFPGLQLPGRPGNIEGAPEDLYLFDVWFDEPGRVGIAVGLAGTILRSADGGANWHPVATDFDTDLYGVGGAGERIVVVGEEGIVAASDDGGHRFSRLATGALPLPFYDVAFASPSRAYLVGPRGRISALTSEGELELLHPRAPSQ